MSGGPGGPRLLAARCRSLPASSPCPSPRLCVPLLFLLARTSVIEFREPTSIIGDDPILRSSMTPAKALVPRKVTAVGSGGVRTSTDPPPPLPPPRPVPNRNPDGGWHAPRVALCVLPGAWQAAASFPSAWTPYRTWTTTAPTAKLSWGPTSACRTRPDPEGAADRKSVV